MEFELDDHNGASTVFETSGASVALIEKRQSRPILPTAWARVVLAQTLPAGQTGCPAAVLAGVKIAGIAALGTLTAAPAVREQRSCSGHTDRC